MNTEKRPSNAYRKAPRGGRAKEVNRKTFLFFVWGMRRANKSLVWHSRFWDPMKSEHTWSPSGATEKRLGNIWGMASGKRHLQGGICGTHPGWGIWGETFELEASGRRHPRNIRDAFGLHRGGIWEASSGNLGNIWEVRSIRETSARRPRTSSGEHLRNLRSIFGPFAKASRRPGQTGCPRKLWKHRVKPF